MSEIALSHEGDRAYNDFSYVEIYSYIFVDFDIISVFISEKFHETVASGRKFQDMVYQIEQQ